MVGEQCKWMQDETFHTEHEAEGEVNQPQSLQYKQLTITRQYAHSNNLYRTARQVVMMYNFIELRYESITIYTKACACAHMLSNI